MRSNFDFSSTTMVSIDVLARCIGSPDCPVLIDGRIDDDFNAGPSFIPGSFRRPGLTAADWAADYAGQDVIVICDKGLKISQGAAAYLRLAGARAWALEGGFQGWRAAGLPLIPETQLPTRDPLGRTHWVTRSRPSAGNQSLEGVACSWLIRRFVDPAAAILFVEEDQIDGVAERFGATKFALPHSASDTSSAKNGFDQLLADLTLSTAALHYMARIVRGASASPQENASDIAAETAGLLAVSYGFAQIYPDDLQQLERSMGLFDALYCWAIDQTETEAA